jgi:hypothetical protein
MKTNRSRNLDHFDLTFGQVFRERVQFLGLLFVILLLAVASIVISTETSWPISEIASALRVNIRAKSRRLIGAVVAVSD